MNSVTAIVPMRHESFRVVGKNWRPLGGRPLFCHVIDALRQSQWVNRVVIDTDSDTIRSIARREFPDVAVIERPEHLRDDRLPMNEVLLNTVGQCDGEYFLQTHSTNPFLQPDTIDHAIEKFFDGNGGYDSLFSVTRFQQRLWDAFTKPVNHNPNVLCRTQDLGPLFFENSCIYLFSRTSLQQCQNRIGRRPAMFEMEATEAWDIDTETDFKIAESLCATQSFKKAAA